MTNLNELNSKMPSIDLLLTDNFPILSLTLVTEPLRVANREMLKEVFHWRILSPRGGIITSSSGFSLNTVAMDYVKRDAVLLLSSYHPERSITPDLLNWLRYCARHGALMGCVDTGALLFAKAGLLEDIPAAAHFEAIAGYAEQFPRALFIDRLYDFTYPRCSSAGGVATIDMTLALIGHYTDASTAKRVAEILTYVPSGHLGLQEKLMQQQSLKMVNRTLAKAVDLMIGSLDAPIAIETIATQCDIPAWKLARLFQKHLHKSPSQYYSQMRLQKARNLLYNSHHSIAIIADLTGFENPESLSRAYKKHFEIPPSEDRKRAEQD